MRHRIPQATYPEATCGPQAVRTQASLFGLAPSGVYHAAAVASSAVRSYRTISTLPAVTDCLGGIFSAALAVGSLRPGVTWHSALRSPDFPPSVNWQRLTGRLPLRK